MIKYINIEVLVHRGAEGSADVMYQIDPEHEGHANSLDSMTNVELGALKAYLRELDRTIAAAEHRRYRADGVIISEFEAR